MRKRDILFGAAYVVVIFAGLSAYDPTFSVWIFGLLAGILASVAFYELGNYLANQPEKPPLPKYEPKRDPDVIMVFNGGPMDDLQIASKIHPSRLVFYRPWDHNRYFCDEIEPERDHALYRLEKIDRKSAHFVEARYVFDRIVPGVIQGIETP